MASVEDEVRSRGQALPLLHEAVMGVERPLRYDACLSGGEGRVDQENVVGGSGERRVEPAVEVDV